MRYTAGILRGDNDVNDVCGVNDVCQAHLSLSPDRIRKLAGGISNFPESEEAFSARIRRVAGELNFAQASVMGWAGKGEASWITGLRCPQRGEPSCSRTKPPGE